MPILQRIEISNFLNSRRHVPWRPDWPHQIFELNGESSALNIPNGKGKSTMFTAILAMLLHHGKSMKDIRMRFFSPTQSGHFTHIRIQIQIPNPGAVQDLVTMSGGDIGGQPMVFGMYGYSGENEKLELYAYQGTFEDCPIASVHKMHHTLITDDAFLGQLKQCHSLFPSNAKERTKRAWQAYVEDFFDTASLKQQLVYQLLRGAEGGHGYFEVNPPAGMNYSAAVFYERLAPELLADVMGELGEEGERGIEDTIHEKVSRVISAKYETARKAEELRRAGNTLRELQGLLDASSKLDSARQAYDKHLVNYSVEMAVLKDVVEERPIPGIPLTPPKTLPALARAMMLQDGQWYIPDRVMAEFTGEPPSEINRRAHERNGLELTHASRAQVIEFNCHIKVRDTRGKPNQLYSREVALALIGLTNNFGRDWTREKAIDAITTSFDWVEANADTNPARALHIQTTKQLEAKQGEWKTLMELSAAHQKEKEELLTEQSQVGEQQAEYRRMSQSKLFTQEELNAPAATGKLVAEQHSTAAQTLESHRIRVSKLGDIYAAWKAYVAEHGESEPGERAKKFQLAVNAAKDALREVSQAISQARNERTTLASAEKIAEKGLRDAEARLNRYVESVPALQRFQAEFGDVSPIGLSRKVSDAFNQANARVGRLNGELSNIQPLVEALKTFRGVHGDVAPALWLSDQLALWDRLGREIGLLNDDLAEATLKREALNNAVIVAGKVAREAADVAGGNFVPLHEAISQMKVGPERRSQVLTLFSALLHAPVYATETDAAQAAKRLDDAGIEAPIFVRPELEKFCRNGEIIWDGSKSYTWLLGIKTRQVECLLDPSLVEREKELAENRIADLEHEIETRSLERIQFNPESEAASIARQAIKAVEQNLSERYVAIIEERGGIEAYLPELKRRASAEMLADIQQVERLLTSYGKTTEIELREKYDEARQIHEQSAERLQLNDEGISLHETTQANLQQELTEATVAAGQVETLLRIQKFMEHAEDNPSFMAGASDVEKELSTIWEAADAKSRFRFDLADLFVKAGYERPRQIEERLGHLRQEQEEIQDHLLPKLQEAIEVLQNKLIELSRQASDIDHFSRELIRRYREFLADQNELVEVSREQIEWHPLGGAAIGIREESALESCARLVIDIADDIEMEESSTLRQAMKEARSTYQAVKAAFVSLVEKVLVVADLDMTEHVRTELQRAKENPALVEHLHAVAQNNYEKNQAANAIASQHLDGEWANLSKWLESFTMRLPDNLRTMKSVFGPKLDKASGALLSAGFVIEANEADRSDIRAVLDEVVRLVEKFETTKRAMEGASAGLRDQAIRGVRAEIRSTFYQKVIVNPRIKVYMPSISTHPLPLEKNMVSTGQGVAMTLLWIVKMADYVTERELRRVTTSRAQQRHLHPTQFALMDGAFSSLSNKGLIKDALDSIKGTRGRFQLVITGHDENYQNNFEYFPTLIEAREINGQFMYADCQTRRLLGPEEVGSHYGAMGVLSMRVVPPMASQ
ncbi:hypothetical protein FGKAn22_06390 [Ferrigenium kumadai]|uniref:Uncharacterized protein n=2 Tax=Ferrigenium kumadai TaxID=1682490 RepID=A0AAN1VZW6_9PROT|nr:hypothetical protein FGKAn22_06390 [Ferrigenium kumadai]